MFILKYIELDCEGYYNIESSVCVAENKETLEQYHKEKCHGHLLEEYTDFRNWCKKNGVDYYKHSNYFTLGEIPLIK